MSNPYPAQDPYPQRPVPGQQLAIPGAPAQPIMVGDIAFTPEGITSPQGRLPLAGAQVTVTNMTRVSRGIPTWAIVVAIVGFFIVTIFSLFFLLAKEDKVEGGYEVRVTSPQGQLSSYVPVQTNTAAWIWNDLQQRAAAARSLIASA